MKNVGKVFESDNYPSKQAQPYVYHRDSQSRSQIKQQMLKYICHKISTEKTSGLILKEKIVGKTGSKSQTEVYFVQHSSPMGIQIK